MGVHIQTLSSDTRPESAAAAALALAGLRFFLAREFSLSLETEIRFVATEAFHAGIRVLPQGAILWTGGLSFAFHIS